MAVMVGRNQFTLRSLLVATAFIAAACALGRFIATTREPGAQFLAAIWIPLLIFAAVGKLRGRVQSWLAYGVLFDGVVITVAAFVGLFI
jgi:hypothetical protein